MRHALMFSSQKYLAGLDFPTPTAEFFFWTAYFQNEVFLSEFFLIFLKKNKSPYFEKKNGSKKIFAVDI